MTQSGNIFETFMPHGQCYLWRADILWLNVLSDAVIALSYLSIPAVLLFVMSRRVPDVPFARVVYMFCLFIFACGITHLFSIWTVWHGQYGLHGLIKAFTAAASLAAVILLFPILPKLMALRSPAELEFANAALREQIELRKLSEAQSIKLQNELASLGRIQSVGKMATGLAHELNQPLLVIATSADTATQVAKQVEQNEPVLYECLEDIQKEAQRASDIIRTLRQFVVKKTNNRKPCDINELVTQAVRIMGGEARNSDTRMHVTAGKLPQVEVDSAQIAQVLVTLIRNAIEAIAGVEDSTGANKRQGRVTVDTNYKDNAVSVTVRDNGPGLMSGVDPFNAVDTDKNSGLGVGLSISRNIVESHGGTLVHNSNPIGGASFTFSLPVSVS
jgi:C4-dicarboxylate-specific signal transduction histidine kinase